MTMTKRHAMTNTMTQTKTKENFFILKREPNHNKETQRDR